MEKLIFENDIKVFGKEVKTFPSGIDEAFKELIEATGDDAGAREYYGVSNMDKNGKMIYKAVAEEKYDGEAKKYNYPESTIEKGTYFFETIKDWRNKTDCIKDVFAEMIKDNRVDKTKPAIEWYKNNDEMLCMIKAL